MKNSTLCYIESCGKYLMLRRDRKKNDENSGKWIGVGGKFEEGESPDDCLIREVREETGFELTSYRLRGIVTFVSDIYETEQMFLFTATADGGVSGGLPGCDEGTLEWVKISDVPALPLWEGDRIFLSLLSEGRGFFLLKLCYRGDRLVSAVLDGREILCVIKTFTKKNTKSRSRAVRRVSGTTTTNFTANMSAAPTSTRTRRLTGCSETPAPVRSIVFMTSTRVFRSRTDNAKTAKREC